MAMQIHRNWALATFALFGFLGIWHWFELRGHDNVKHAFTALLVVAGLLLAVTAWRGGGLVYEHGLGVQSLPEVSDAGGEQGAGGHDHGDGGHDTADVAAPAVITEAAVSDDGHDHVHDGAMAMDGPAGAINAFRKALGSGDKEAAVAALAAEVVIYESGFVEASRDAYASHHMLSDMAFLQAVSTSMTGQTVHAMGDMAMVLTESRTTGTYNDKAVDYISLETAILHQAGDGWKVIHLHWGGRAAEK
jgi:ketosteroid isomerase-like protein